GFIPVGTTSNCSLSIGPIGNGFLCAQIPTPGNIQGGDCRGIKSVDWQMERNNSDEVANAPYSSILGGINNKIDNNSDYSSISGGNNNYIQTSQNSNISNGNSNIINNSNNSSMLSGNGNFINNAIYSVILSGENNTTLTISTFIGTGQQNLINQNSDFSVILNGNLNKIGLSDNDAINYGLILNGTSNNIQGQSDYASIFQ